MPRCERVLLATGLLNGGGRVRCGDSAPLLVDFSIACVSNSTDAMVYYGRIDIVGW